MNEYAKKIDDTKKKKKKRLCIKAFKPQRSPIFGYAIDSLSTPFALYRTGSIRNCTDFRGIRPNIFAKRFKHLLRSL